MGITENIVKRLRESRREIPAELSNISSELLQKVREEVINFMISEGFPKDEAEDYIRVDVSFSDDMLVVEVGAELSYEGLETLCDKLNPIVSDYDGDSYFEPVTSGIIGAWLNPESILSSMNDSKEVLDADDMRAELVKYGDFTEEEASKLKGLDLAKAWSELPRDIKESEEKRMEFATESEAREWADENGYAITSIQNGTHSNQACICWMKPL